MAIRELQGHATGLDLTPEQRRRFNAVNYRLDGSRIKAALAANPGKVIVAPRQSGKTTALAQFVSENYPEGVIVYCLHEQTAHAYTHIWNDEYFQKCIVVWGGAEPARAYGCNRPVFADDLMILLGAVQQRIIRHPAFMGAVSSVSDLRSPGVRELCILY